MRDVKEVVESILSADWENESKKQRVITKHFSVRPYIVDILCEKFEFDTLRVVDVGCSFGNTLFYWGPSSKGIDVSIEMASLPLALGYDVHITNVEDRLAPPEWNGWAQGVYSNNLIEHLLSPHLFLVRIHKLLGDGGLLALGHPTVPSGRITKKIWLARTKRHGFLATEHINYYTSETIRYMLIRAGFEIVYQWSPLPFSTPRILAKTFGGLLGNKASHCYTVARKITDWRYPKKRLPQFDPEYGIEELKSYH